MPYAISKGTARNNFQNKLKSVLRLLEMLSESTRVFSPSLSTVKDFFYAVSIAHACRTEADEMEHAGAYGSVDYFSSRLTILVEGAGGQFLKFSRSDFTNLLNMSFKMGTLISALVFFKFSCFDLS